MYSMKDVCKQAGITYQTLKFYCNEGLIPNVKRDKNNYRVFDDEDLNWIKSLQCLKNCRLSIKEIKTYLSLCRDGKETVPERKEMLARQKSKLIEEIKLIETSIAFIDKKQRMYDAVLNGEAEYNSYFKKD